MEEKYYEDYQIGQEFISPGRTVTEADIVAYAGISGDYSQLHISQEHARKTQFGQRVAHGLLGLTIAQGLETWTDIGNYDVLGYGIPNFLLDVAVVVAAASNCDTIEKIDIPHDRYLHVLSTNFYRRK